MNQALLSFSLGPVQDFIAAARTTRDLWTGSYLLSWLTAHAMAEILNEPGAEIIAPNVSGNPLLRFVQGVGGNGQFEDVLSPCLPQTFLAEVRGDEGEIRDRIIAAVRAEWRSVADAARGELKRHWDAEWPVWDERWSEQIDDFWDIRVHVLPASTPTVTEMQRMLASNEADESNLRREYLARLAAADKNIRHFPRHEFDANGQPDTRPKCSLLGSFAQMGPRSNSPAMTTSREFWHSVVDQQDQRLIAGTRLGRRDRFCAVSLVKRFAWGAYFAPQFGHRVAAFAFPDVDTICAGKWLADAMALGLKHREIEHWSGHWLRWKDQIESRQADSEEREDCPDDETWRRIRAAKDQLGQPPGYFAVLMLDGDRMGELMRHADKDLLKVISGTLAEFALNSVRPLVEAEHHGKLVYAGGDDVLALLPTTTALACANNLRQRFTQAMRDKHIGHRDGSPVTVSGGLVIAHAKANLRDVLQAARAAEHQAKQEGKDRLTVVVLRRSGEHTSVSCQWDQVEKLTALVGEFSPKVGQRGESDRWAYLFRRELESALPDHSPALLDAELWRLLGRAEGASSEFKQLVQTLWNDYDGRACLAAAKRFTQLIQSASFLARGGREER